MATNTVEDKNIIEEDRTRALVELLYHVSRELATALDLRTVLQRVISAAIQNVGGERGSIVVLDDNGKAVDSTIVFGKRFRDDTTHQLQDIVDRGLAGWVVRNRKPAMISDTSTDDRWLKRPRSTGSLAGKSALCVPLLAREKLVGVLTLVHSQANAFHTGHLELMQAISDQAGIAILNARLYTESQRQARVMSALAESAAAINTSLRLDNVLHRILNQTIQALQVETVALALTDPPSGELIFRAATGNNAGHILNHHIPQGEGLAGSVLRNGHGMVVPNVSADPRFRLVDRLGNIEMRAVALAPIQAQGKVIGVLEAINPVSSSFDPDAMLVLNGLGGLAGTTIQNAQLFEKLDAAHQNYRELFEDNIDPILLTDWEGNVLDANRQALDLSGYESGRLQELNIDRLHEIDWAKTGLKFEKLKPYQTFSYESELHMADGRVAPVQVSVRPVEFEDANVLQWIMHDVSERKALDDLRNDLTAMVYHDLRSPLANIISSLDILKGLIKSSDNEAVDSILTIAANSTTRIERLISSLLDINRLESGQKIVEQQAIGLTSLIAQTVKELQPVANSRKQKLIVELPKKLPAVWVDEGMILRVLINLVENAAKFTPVAGEITISAKEDAGWIEVSVKDTGPGILAKDQVRIFDKFARVRGQGKPGGLGIGLAFCRMAIEGHGGRIWVESENGEGTTFKFTLPIAKEGQSAESQGD